MCQSGGKLRPLRCVSPRAQQYVGMLHILDRLITLQHFVKPLLFEGGMSSAKRDRAVRRFQSDPACQVCLCCIHHLPLHDLSESPCRSAPFQGGCARL